jgi:hypothetical protein
VARPGRSLRFVAVSALFLAAAWPEPAFSQPSCTLQEERRLSTLTGRFSVGSMTVSLTLPRSLFGSDATTVYLEVAGGIATDREDLLRDNPWLDNPWLESGGTKVMIRNGAAIQLTPRVNERVVLSIASRDGQRLCAWTPTIRVLAHSPPRREEGFRTERFDYTRIHSGFRNAGDPILLEVGGKLANETSEFRIDGLPAMVLARTSWQVILRDPHPAAGMRTIESQVHSITLPFLVLQLELPNAPPNGRATLRIRVLGRNLLELPALPWGELMLVNFNRERLNVRCGKAYRNESDWDESRFIPLTRDRGGDFTAVCKVDLRQPGPVSMDGRFFERQRPRPLPSHIPLTGR